MNSNTQRRNAAEANFVAQKFKLEHNMKQPNRKRKGLLPMLQWLDFLI
jgi:hypothetical protein